MLTPSQISEAKRAIAKAVETFSPERQPSLKLLAEFRGEIIALRKKGAGYKVIAAILDAANVHVSIATISRYCRTLPGVSQVKSKPANQKPATKPVNGASKSSNSQPRLHSSQRSVLGKLPDGPRIADPSTL